MFLYILIKIKSRESWRLPEVKREADAFEPANGFALEAPELAGALLEVMSAQGKANAFNLHRGNFTMENNAGEDVRTEVQEFVTAPIPSDGNQGHLK